MIQCKPLAMLLGEERQYNTAANAERGLLLKRFHPHRRHVLGVAFNQTKLLTCSADGTCQVFERMSFTDARPVLVYSNHADAVFGCQFLDSRKVLTWSRDCSAKVWDCQTGETFLTLSHARSVKSAVCEGDFIITFSLPKTLSIFSASDGKLLQSIDEFYPLASPLAVCLPHFVFGTYGSHLHVGTLNENGLFSAGRLKCHSRAILAVAIHKSTRRVLTGSEDKTAKLIDIYAGDVMQEFIGHGESVLGCAFDPKREDICLTTSADKTSRLWNCLTGECIMLLKSYDAVNCGVLSSGSVLVGCADNSAMLFDVSQGCFDRLVALCLGLKDKKSMLSVIPIEVVRRIKPFLV